MPDMNNDARNMATEMKPGPYEMQHGTRVVVLDPKPDVDGEVVARTGPRLSDYDWVDPKELTLSDSWPEWWPFPDTPIPEPEPQVGEFWESDTGRIAQVYRLDRPQVYSLVLLDSGGLRAHEYLRADLRRQINRPENWPL